MLPPRWYKIIDDLWSNRTRTLIVALAVAVGVYAVGSVQSIQAVILREYRADQASAAAAHAIIRTTPFDEELAERMAELPGVAAAEGRQTISARVLTGPNTTRDILLEAIADLDDQQVDRYLLLEGRWPTRKDEIVVEWMGLDYLGAEIGDTITLELSDYSRKTLTITGSAHNPQYPSPDVIGFTLAAISPETLTYLGRSDLFTELHIRVAEDTSEETVRAVVRTVEAQFERTGRVISGTTIVGESMIESIINTVVLILSMFGWIILLLSAFLVINTVAALISRQINQIGIMKLVGASRGQIMQMYIVLVLVYGLLAFIIGMPLSIATMRLLMTRLVEGLLNLRSDSYAVPIWVYATMIGVGLLIPLAAGLLPVWQGTRVTCFAALNSLSIDTSGIQRSQLQRALMRLPQGWLERPLVLAIRNSLRHRGRLLRTVIVLTLGTALYIAVISVQASVNTTLNDFLRYHQYDVQVQMIEPQRIARLEALVRARPEVRAVETWGVASATRLRSDGTKSNRYSVYGLPEDSQMVAPVVQMGRWLIPEDGNAVVINAIIADREPDIRPGDTIILDMAGHERPYSVVGIVTTDGQGAKIYMNLRPFAEITRTIGKASTVQVVTHDPAHQSELADQLLRDFETAGLEVYTTRTNESLNMQNELMFDVIVGFLILMAVLLGAVGTLGLSTTMSINMAERVREIGVMRAIGASNHAIRRVVIMEGLAIALISWFLGFLLSFPTAHLASDQIGRALLDMPLAYTYSTRAAFFWLGVLLVLAATASLGPAQRAVKLTVREVLAYE